MSGKRHSPTCPTVSSPSRAAPVRWTSWEALSWAQLGYHADPVGLLNTGGYYDHLVAFWDKMGEVGFLRPQHRELLIVDTMLDGLLDRMGRHVPTQPIVRMNADDL